MWEYESYNHPRICKRCKKLHLTEDYYCEHCLYNLLDDEPTLQNVGRAE